MPQRDWCAICDELGVVATIVDAEGGHCLCLNCLAMVEYDEHPAFVNSCAFVDDVTGQPGAVQYNCMDESYTVSAETLQRLIGHHLYPAEYKALVQKYGCDKFLLHSDFYSETGFAYQPCDYITDKLDEMCIECSMKTCAYIDAYGICQFPRIGRRKPITEKGKCKEWISKT